jgi:chromosome segregation ATPase
MMEMELPDMDDKKSTLNSWVAVTVVVLSVVMALCKIKDDNIVQAMQVTKADAVDTWAEYQSKRLKVYINESSVAQAELNANKEAVQAYTDKLKAKIADLNKDADSLKAKAQDLEKQYDALGYRDDQFDLSDALLSIAIAVAAVAALTEKRKMLILSWIFGTGGTIFGVAGFAGWALHPDWIIKFLT